MAELHKNRNIEIEIDQETAKQELVELSRSHDSNYYACGLIDKGVGYYQLAYHPDLDKRILYFGINLEDMKQEDRPGIGRIFATPHKLFHVKAYDKSATVDEIKGDIDAHQLNIRKVIREDYTLVHTGPHVYQSRAISYLISAKPEVFKEPSGDPDEDLYVHAYIDALHEEDYAHVYPMEGGRLSERARYSRVRITDKPIKAKDAPYCILEHNTEILKCLARGRDAIQEEDKFLRPHERFFLRLKVNGARFLSRTVMHWQDRDWEKPGTYFELFFKSWAVRNIALGTASAIANPALAVMKSVGELIEFAGNIFDVLGPEGAGSQKRIPEELRPYIEAQPFNTRLNHHLRPVKISGMEYVIPLDAYAAKLCPHRHPLLMNNPFDHKPRCDTDKHPEPPSLNAVRSMLGTMRRIYPRKSPTMSLLMQANGLWVAQCRKTDTVYVGYNADMDTDNKPLPPPPITDWLGVGKVIRFQMHARDRLHDYVTDVISLGEAKLALEEIIKTGDEHLLRADEPRREIHKHVTRIEPKARFNAITGEYVKTGETPKKSWPMRSHHKKPTIAQPVA